MERLNGHESLDIRTDTQDPTAALRARVFGGKGTPEDLAALTALETDRSLRFAMAESAKNIGGMVKNIH